jgi:hypothetical protein
MTHVLDLQTVEMPYQAGSTAQAGGQDGYCPSIPSLVLCCPPSALSLFLCY